MSRPNKPRNIGAERALAARIEAERLARRWSLDTLAAEMTAVGCPIAASAVWKAVNSDPPRHITVDELVGFSLVFNIPPEVLIARRQDETEREN